MGLFTQLIIYAGIQLVHVVDLIDLNILDVKGRCLRQVAATAESTTAMVIPSS